MAVAKTAMKDPPAVELDPFLLENVVNPYSFQHELRETAPVVWLDKYKVYAVGRFEEARRVSSDHETFSSASGIGINSRRVPWREPNPITETDPPEHTVTRKGVQKILTPPLIRSWRERFENGADALIESVLQQREVDGATEIAQDYVLSVFPDALGLHIRKEIIPVIGETNFWSLGPTNERHKAAIARAEPMLAEQDEALKRENVRPGSFGDIVYQAEDCGDFPPGVGEGVLRNFFRGGTDNTYSGIGTMLMYLATNPHQWRAMQSNHGLVKNALDEAIRIDSPIQMLHRVTTQEVELSGYRLPAEARIGFYHGAAGRDPRQWHHAEQFNLQRDIKGLNLSFGVGAHLCIGQMVARFLSEALLTALLKRVDSVDLVGEPIWKPVNVLRSLKSLPIKLTPA